MPTYAKLRTDLVAVEAEIDGQTVFNIKDPRRGNYFRLRAPEYWLVSQLDGATPYGTIAARFKEKYQANISESDVEGFVQVLEQQFFLENTRAEQELSRKSYQTTQKATLFSRLLFIKIRAFNPQKFLNQLVRVYRPFHSLWSFAIQVILIVLGLYLLTTNLSYFAVDYFEIFQVSSIVTIVLAFFILVSFHEFAHAVICRYYGGEVREMGFLFLYFQPCFYCDLSDAWLFRIKRQRLAVTWAGPYFQFLLMALAIIIWRVTVPGTAVSEVSRLVTIVAGITLFFNLNPLIKLDGYYLLSDWLDIPNLRSKAFAYMKNWFERVVLGWPVLKTEASARQKRIFFCYSVLAIAYSAFLIPYLLWLFGAFLYDKFGASGPVVLTAGLLYALRQNIFYLWKGLLQHLLYMKDILKRPARLISYLVLTGLLIVLLFFIRLPHRITGEVSVRPIAEFELLLNDFGLLEKKFRQGGASAEVKSSYLQTTTTEMASLDLLPKVRDGQKVIVGDTLAMLISNQVIREIVGEQSVLQKLESDLALLKSPPKKEAIDEATAEVRAAQAVYDQRKRDAERAHELMAKNLSSQEALEGAQATEKVAYAELENKKAKLRLLKSPPKPEEEAVIVSEIEKQKAKLQFLQNQKDAQSILSPIDGMVIIDKGEDAFLSIIDNSLAEVLVPVSDFDINWVKANQPTKVKVRSYTDEVFEGSVVYVPRDATLNDGHAHFMVSAVIDNDKELLRKGMTGYAKIEVGETSLFMMILRRVAATIRVEFWSWW